MATINLATKYEKKLDERFKLASVTDAYAGKQYDFDGVNSIKIWTVDQVPINDYNRSASASRFGTINELGDTVQTLTMTQDKAYTFAIDYGNAGEQFNIKHCNAVLKQVWDEQVTPQVDAYRLKVWANGAGITEVNSTALTESTVVKALLTAHAALSNKRVPKGKARVTFVSESLAISAKLATNLQYNESYTSKTLINGQISKINGSPIVAVPDDLLPPGVDFMIKYKGATVDPMKRKVLRVQTHPVGFDADIGEGRYIHDAFVLDQKINGIYVYATTGVAATPTISITGGGEVTLTATGSDGIKYTLDGTNPKTSSTAKVYAGGSKPNAPAGTVVRAYAYKSGQVNSGVAESKSAG